MSTDAASTDSPHFLDSRYRLIERIGHGGSATVWRAHDERLDRMVAIKVVDAASAQQVRAEALALAQLSHPHIASVFDVGSSDGEPYIVMEYVAGRPLSDVLADEGLSWAASVSCAAQVASALAAAHERGIVHRDVTPANVMLTSSGAKLVDFGISAVEGEPEVDGDGGLRGTPAYVAPERLGNLSVTPAADVYSLGVVLYQALSGRLPRWVSTVGEIRGMRTPAAPAPLPRGIPDDVARTCLRCLADEPGDRPDAEELATALNAATPPHGYADLRDAANDHFEPTHLVPHFRSANGRRTGPRHRRSWSAVFAALLAIALVGWSATSWSPFSDDPLPSAIAGPNPPVLDNPRAAPSCAVTFQLTADDGQYFTAAIAAVSRTAPLPAGWQLAMKLPTEWAHMTSQGWLRVADGVASAPQPEAAAGVSSSFTLSGLHAGTIALPTNVNVNGRSCDLVLLDSSGRLATPGPVPNALVPLSVTPLDSEPSDKPAKKNAAQKTLPDTTRSAVPTNVSSTTEAATPAQGGVERGRPPTERSSASSSAR